MTEAPEILLAHHLKTLKLPTFLREYDKLARHCAAEGLDHVRFLARLVELELIDRERRMIERRIKSAKFPAVKSLDSFDFKAIPSLNKMQVLELARCRRRTPAIWRKHFTMRLWSRLFGPARLIAWETRLGARLSSWVCSVGQSSSFTPPTGLSQSETRCCMTTTRVRRPILLLRRCRGFRS